MALDAGDQVLAPDDQPGLRLLSNVVELVPDQVRIGMPVHVTFEQHEDVWLPLFKKAE